MTFGSLNLIFHIHIFLFHTPYPTQAGGRNAVCLCFYCKNVSRETFHHNFKKQKTNCFT